jgi:hypothetical protein
MLLLAGCNNGNLKKKNVPGLTVVFDSIWHLTKIERTDTIAVKSAKQIKGSWVDLGKETLIVDITINTITYREHHESHKFKIRGDSIYIYYFDFILSGRPYVVKDTFIISMQDGKDKYLRVKK